jgi:hypothetical protein
MLTFSDQQVTALEERMLQRLQNKLERVTARIFPEIEKGQAGTGAAGIRIAQMVETGIERAVGFDIEQPADIAAFIALVLSLRLTPPKSDADWIRQWLARAGTPGAGKLAVVEFRLTEAQGGEPAFAVCLERMKKARAEVLHGVP